MLRRLLIVSMAFTLALTSVGCGNSDRSQSPANSSQGSASESPVPPQNQLANGEYPVQQATYNDGNGEYSVALLNTKPGESSVYRAENIPMARLTDEEVSAGKKSYLKVENGQPSLHLTEDFKIEYTHNVTEKQTNPQTGQQETVVVRQESSFWTPFAGALAGQALGSLLFRPQYYVPPIYQPGGSLVGFGGYGSSYGQAVSRYQSRYQAPPAEVRNRQTFRTTGRLGSPSSQTGVRTPQSSNNSRSTGSGYGSSTLRRNDAGKTNRPNRSFGSGFGSRGMRRR